MFQNIDNKSGLKSVQDPLFDNSFDLHSIQCIVDALEICLTCSKSKFNKQHFLQTEATAQGIHMSCFYNDVTTAEYGSLTNKFYLRPRVWNRFRDDVSVL